MRLYSLTNMYTSGIHAGIQTAHAVHEMFTKYGERGEEGYKLHDWARSHKTIIVLNGGYQSHLEEAYKQIGKLATDLKLPYSKFHESKEALNEALTAIAIIIPQEIYDMQPEDYSDERLYRLNSNPQNMTIEIAEVELARLIKSFGLAK